MSQDELQERRLFKRVLFEAPVTLHRDNQTIDSTLIDISLKGALIQRPSDCHCASGDRFDLQVALNQGQVTIAMHTQVVRTNNRHVGLKCLHIDLDSITHLRRLIELNLGDNTLLEREISALG